MKEVEIKCKIAYEHLDKAEEEFNSLDLCNCSAEELDEALEKLRAAQAKVEAAKDYKNRTSAYQKNRVRYINEKPRNRHRDI